MMFNFAAFTAAENSFFRAQKRDCFFQVAALLRNRNSTQPKIAVGSKLTFAPDLPTYLPTYEPLSSRDSGHDISEDGLIGDVVVAAAAVVA